MHHSNTVDKTRQAIQLVKNHKCGSSHDSAGLIRHTAVGVLGHDNESDNVDNSAPV